MREQHPTIRNERGLVKACPFFHACKRSPCGVCIAFTQRKSLFQQADSLSAVLSPTSVQIVLPQEVESEAVGLRGLLHVEDMGYTRERHQARVRDGAREQIDLLQDV